MHALTLEQSGGGFYWRAIGSLYDFEGRAAHSLGRASGSKRRRRRVDRPHGRHRLAHARFPRLHPRLRPARISAPAPIMTASRSPAAASPRPTGAAATPARSPRHRAGRRARWRSGREDRWRFRPRSMLTLGARYEWWRAYGGLNFSLAPRLTSAAGASAEAAFAQGVAAPGSPADRWTLTLSAGRRFASRRSASSIRRSPPARRSPCPIRTSGPSRRCPPNSRSDGQFARRPRSPVPVPRDASRTR